MIELEVVETEYPYYETPESWFPILDDFVSEVNNILDMYNLPRDSVELIQTKEKFGQLRIYYSINRLLDDDLSGLDLIMYKALDSLISIIVDKYESIVRYKVKIGEL